MKKMMKLQWAIRNGLWNRIVAMKFSTNQDLHVTRLKKDLRKLEAVPLSTIYPGITIQDVLIGARTPCDEQYPQFRYILRRFFSQLFMWMNRIYPPVMPGLPEIDANPQMAVAQAYTDRHRYAVSKAAKRHGLAPSDVLAPPVIPRELNGIPDLGTLAVQGPFAGYIRKAVSQDIFEWDLRSLGEYSTKPGLQRLGVRVQFQRDHTGKKLTPLMIESSLGRSYPSDANWAIAEQLALCTLSTHTSLIRHWNWVHLIGGEALSIVTRNTLPEDHPFCRLLWPHIFGTQASNRLCTESQLVPGGDFESVFSYAHKEMYGLFTDTVGAFDVQDWDPQAASAKRGILPEGMDLPTGNNLEALFDVMYRHTTRYLSMYYASDAEVRADRGICQWVDELSKALPNGLPMTPETLTQASLARFASSCIYFASVQHDLVGAFLWNYQLWTHAMPVQVACDGRRESLDVYQRLVNTNFMLNTPRAPLMSDLTAIALPDSVRPDRRVRAVDAFVRFREELIALQQMMEREPWMPWKLYPKNLEVNINA